MITKQQDKFPGADYALQLVEEGLLSEVLGYETHEVAAQAKGTSVDMVTGDHFIDFTGGIAVHACGHNHPAVVEAVIEQAKKVLHTSDVMLHAPELEIAEFLRARLREAMPNSSSEYQFLFLNGGSESIDAVAKLALKATGKSKFISFDGAFHGRTLWATALSRSKTLQWSAYEPVISGLRQFIYHAPPPRLDPNAEAFEALLKEHEGEIAAVYFEAVQGEGGYHPMPVSAAKKIRELTRERGILLVADEIQSGMGRTGKWFGFQHLGIEPDIVVFGKAVGGGLPLAGFAASRAVMEKWQPGEHGTTFGGNPIACAAGLAALKTIEANGLVEASARLGERIKSRLSSLIGRYGVVDVRGHGLMLALELRGADGKPDYARCEAVKGVARENGLLVMNCGAKTGGPNDNSAIRLIPPLNTPDEVADRALDILTDALAAKS